MIQFIIRRIGWALITIVFISMVSFVIIQLPPGDFLTSYVARLREMGETIDQGTIDNLRDRYGLDQPLFVQYWKWVSRMPQGDFGRSFATLEPVSLLIWGRLQLTLLLSLITLFFTWIISIPLGIYSAVKQYSILDYIGTFLGFIGLAIPNFMLALGLMYVSFRYFNVTITGLFSPEYINAPWSIARVLDMMRHIWVPILVVGTSGTAALLRIMRANLLDELSKPYLVTALAKGLPYTKAILKYPVRVALNPFVSTVGWTLPALISGEIITSVVLNLPTAGPLLLQSLQNQDMYLAGAFVLLLSILTVFGTLLSDILLAVLDPRIRLQ